MLLLFGNVTVNPLLVDIFCSISWWSFVLLKIAALYPTIELIGKAAPLFKYFLIDTTFALTDDTFDLQRNRWKCMQFAFAEVVFDWLIPCIFQLIYCARMLQSLFNNEVLTRPVRSIAFLKLTLRS
jgi:hypothetical protein